MKAHIFTIDERHAKFLNIMRESDHFDYRVVINGEQVLLRNNTALQRRNYLDSNINSRAAWFARLAKHAVDGKVWCHDGGYDMVDHVRFSSNPYVLTVDAAKREYMRCLVHQDGECPTWFATLSAEEAEYTKGGHRDLIMEAFEDGHPHVVSNVRFECN